MESLGLQELVDAPRERLDVEYKAWLDLTERETSAKLAKHLCALANFGGGVLVFGIDDDMTPAGLRPAAAGPYDQDTLSGIVKRYLTPAFQVAVHEVTLVGTKTSHPVVWVPSHEAIPVCSARGGPEVGGKPVGIVRGDALHAGTRSGIGGDHEAGTVGAPHSPLRTSRKAGVACGSRTDASLTGAPRGRTGRLASALA